MNQRQMASLPWLSPCRQTREEQGLDLADDVPLIFLDIDGVLNARVLEPIHS